MSGNRSLVPLASLSAERSDLLARLLDGLNPTELQWLSGYVAGLAAGGTSSREPAPVAHVVPSLAPLASPLTVVYGTQTGNSRALAERIKQRTEAAGLPVRIFRASDYPLKELKEERVLYVVISTQGDGDPPDDARAFFDFVRGKRAPQLPNLRFSVLGLGDSSYPKYCYISRIIDERFAELGGKRLFARGECDVDFEKPASAWVDEALEHVKRELEQQSGLAPVTPIRVAASSVSTRDHPFTAAVLANQRITGRNAQKDVRHVELSLEGSGLSYQPGDSLGVWPVNPQWLAESILKATSLDGSAPVARDGQSHPLQHWLTRELEITRLSRPFILAHAERSKDAAFKELVGNADKVQALLASHQVVDLVQQHPATWSAAELVSSLRRLTPRLYSIASSQKRTPDEVHLTVARVEYDSFGSRHVGTASDYLALQRPDEGSVRVFVEHNDRFHLPRDPLVDVIMVGPGTGVAPFRAFVQDRQESGAKGRNWLFFGDQQFRHTFLYQVEWQDALKKGALTRLDLAFSRDQERKIYVQHRMLEKGADLYAWLEGGAYVYVCGDSKRMAPDVEEALLQIAMQHGKKDRDGAQEWLDGLREQQRYLRDVY